MFLVEDILGKMLLRQGYILLIIIEDAIVNDIYGIFFEVSSIGTGKV